MERPSCYCCRGTKWESWNIQNMNKRWVVCDEERSTYVLVLYGCMALVVILFESCLWLDLSIIKGSIVVPKPEFPRPVTTAVITCSYHENRILRDYVEVTGREANMQSHNLADKACISHITDKMPRWRVCECMCVGICVNVLEAIGSSFCQ